MAKTKGKTSDSIPTWTSTQSYALAVICLVVGIAVGYLVRGSATPQTAPVQSAAQSSAGMPGAGQQPTPEQMKHMADKQAESLLAQLKNTPNNPSLLAEIGNLYYDAQQFTEAIAYYERALNIDPNNPNIRTDMGTAYYYTGDADRALKEFDTALRSDPKHAQTMFNMGMVKWQGKNDVNGAVATWEKLLQIAPADYPDRAKVQQLISKAKEHTSMAPGTTTTKPASM